MKNKKRHSSISILVIESNIDEISVSFDSFVILLVIVGSLFRSCKRHLVCFLCRIFELNRRVSLIYFVRSKICETFSQGFSLMCFVRSLSSNRFSSFDADRERLISVQEQRNINKKLNYPINCKSKCTVSCFFLVVAKRKIRFRFSRKIFIQVGENRSKEKKRC